MSNILEASAHDNPIGFGEWERFEYNKKLIYLRFVGLMF